MKKKRKKTTTCADCGRKIPYVDLPGIALCPSCFDAGKHASRNVNPFPVPDYPRRPAQRKGRNGETA